MGYSLREIAAERKFSQTLSFDTFAQVLPPTALAAALAAEQVQTPCERKLNLSTTMMVIIALHLYPHLAIDDIMRKLAQGLRFLWPDPDYDLPGASAFSYRRAHLGARPSFPFSSRSVTPWPRPRPRAPSCLACA